MKKIIFAVLLVSCLLFLAACSADPKAGDSQKDGSDNISIGETIVEEQTPAPTDPPPPTDPPTEKPTEPPTEPPTDPENLPEPDKNGFIAGARYYLWSPNSNLYLTCDKWGELTQEEYTGTPDQMFVFEPLELENGKTAYKIRPLGTNDGYLDTDGGDGDTNGLAVIVTKEPEGENSHFWSLAKQSKPKGIDLPTLSIMSVISKNKRSFDVVGISKDPGAKIQVWEGGGSDNHKLVFELVADVEQGKIIPRGLQELPEED